MRSAVIVCAAMLYCIGYAVYSRHERSWINLLTPQFVLGLPSLFFLDLAYLQYERAEYSVYSYVYIYLCYSVPFAVAALYLTKNSAFAGRFRRADVMPAFEGFRVRAAPYVFLLGAVCLYIPIIVEFREDLFNARSIYEQTRSGYGVGFFISSALSTIAYALSLFLRPRRFARAQKLFFFVSCTVLAYLHGSKSQIVTLVFLFILHRRYIEGRRTSLGSFLMRLSVFACVLAALFYSFSSGIEFSDLFRTVVGYSDYSRNGMLVIDDDQAPLFGRLVFEDNVFSRIPRVLFPDKPKDYGSFYLAKKYFSSEFDLDAGAPAFGVGTLYADFKYLTLPCMCIGSLFTAWLAGFYLRRVRRRRAPADFLMLAFCANVSVVSVGVGYLLPEHYAMATLLGWLLLRRRRDGPNLETTKRSAAPNLRPSANPG